MKKTLAVFIGLLCFIYVRSSAQTQKIIDNDSLLHVFLRQDKFSLDTGAHAVILSERGNAALSVKRNNYGSYEILEYTIERCIRINSQQALELADVSIPSAKNIKVKNMDFQSVNLENGQIIKQKIRKPDILKEKLSKNAKIYKFNLPNVKPGTIIYYSYTYQFELGKTATSSYFPLPWNFQNDYPTLESMFTISVPVEINYTVIPKNIHFDTVRSLADFNKSEHAQFSDSTFLRKELESVTTSWVRRNVSKIPDIEFLKNPESKKERLNIYISSFFILWSSSETAPVIARWGEANERWFYKNTYLGNWIFHPDDTLSVVLNKISTGTTENLIMAKDIYRFVRDSIECTGYSQINRIWSSRSPKNALLQKKGTVSDMNILLCALLHKAGLRCYPILLCTADEDKIDERHFEPDALNYMISLLIIGDKYYFLDPSSRYLPFGVLKPRCYNDFSWIVSENGAGVSLCADSLTDKSTSTVTVKPGAHPGAYKLFIEQRHGNITGPSLRQQLEKDSTELKKEFERKISNLKYNIKLNKCTIHNARNADTSLIITYDLDLQLDTTSNISYLNPFFHKLFETNPFIAAERKYPVEFGNPFQHLFILKFQLGKGYRFEDYENPVSLSFGNGSISYKHTTFYNSDDNILNLSCVLSSKTSVVAPEYYNELRSFYDRIITEQNKKLIIKKTDL